MEEAWELAALDMGDILETDVDKRDWSGRHVRLKFQMVSSCLFVWMMENYEVTSVNLLFVRFDNVEAPEHLQTFAYLFAIFSIVSFIVRSFYESPSVGKMEPAHYDVVDGQIKKIVALKAKVTEFSKFPVSSYSNRVAMKESGSLQARTLNASIEGEVTVFLNSKEANFFDAVTGQAFGLKTQAEELEEFEDKRIHRALKRAFRKTWALRTEFCEFIEANPSASPRKMTEYSKQPVLILDELLLQVQPYKWTHWAREIFGGLDHAFLSLLIPLGFSIFLLLPW